MNKARRKKSKPEGWREVKLGEICTIMGGGTPNTKVPEYWDGDIPWLTPKDLSGFSGIYISNGERNISELGLKNSSAKLLPKNAVLLTTRAPVGYLAISKNEVSTNQGFRSLIPDEKTNTLFLFYLLKRNVAHLKSQSSGTTFGELTGTTLKSLSFLFPPLAEQKAIAEVLSSLDDKIDLLHRQNKTFEDMAQTLFRQWFIEEANEEWEEIKLGDIATFHYGKSLTKQNRVGGDIPVFSSAGLVGFHNKALTDTPGIIIGRKGTVGKVYYSKTPFYCIDTAFYILPSDKYSLEFLFYLLLTLNLDELNEDSAVPGLNRDTAYRQKVFLPPMELMKRFESAVKPLFNKIKSNQHSIYSLMNLRDALLPKLISGKISVRP